MLQQKEGITNQQMRALSHALQTRWYWISLLLAGVTLLAVALFYQYALGDEPCQVCIHARLWVAAFTLIALIMLVTPQTSPLRVVGNVGVLIAGAGLFERARYLYRLENGIGDGSCQFQLGMPDWFAVDRWMPWLFEVRNLCSFTPEMLFGLSMAEALMAVGAGICLIAVWVAIRDVAGHL